MGRATDGVEAEINLMTTRTGAYGATGDVYAEKSKTLPKKVDTTDFVRDVTLSCDEIPLRAVFFASGPAVCSTTDQHVNSTRPSVELNARACENSGRNRTMARQSGAHDFHQRR